MKNPAFKRDSFIIKRSILSFLLFGLQFGGVNLVDRLTVNLRSRPLKDVFLLNSQQINVRFALRYLQVFVSLRLKTCILYDKQDLSPALIVQFVGRPTEPQTSLVSARRQD